MNKAEFFKAVRATVLGPTLDDSEVSGCESILDAMQGLPLSHCAYALATAFHETAHTMQPISEFGGPKYLTRMYDCTGDRPAMAQRMGNIDPGDGCKYCGRGYVQLTWRSNYAKAGGLIGENLITNPEKAMRPDVAAKIMRGGMTDGWFTGKALRDYLPARKGTLAQYTAARRIINGQDRAADIAGFAMKFQTAREAGGWA